MYMIEVALLVPKWMKDIKISELANIMLVTVFGILTVTLIVVWAYTIACSIATGEDSIGRITVTELYVHAKRKKILKSLGNDADDIIRLGKRISDETSEYESLYKSMEIPEQVEVNCSKDTDYIEKIVKTVIEYSNIGISNDSVNKLRRMAEIAEEKEKLNAIMKSKEDLVVNLVPYWMEVVVHDRICKMLADVCRLDERVISFSAGYIQVIEGSDTEWFSVSSNFWHRVANKVKERIGVTTG